MPVKIYIIVGGIKKDDAFAATRIYFRMVSQAFLQAFGHNITLSNDLNITGKIFFSFPSAEDNACRQANSIDFR